MNEVELQEKLMRPFSQFAKGIEKTLDPKLSLPLLEFFSKAVESGFNRQNSIMTTTVGDDGTLIALGIDGETLFSQPCPLTKNPEAMQEICGLMAAMIEGTRRAIEKLKR